MKGGIVVALAALTALKEANALDGMHITVVMHGDEEDSGRPLSLARATLIEAAKAADIAIGLENGGGRSEDRGDRTARLHGLADRREGAQRALLADLHRRSRRGRDLRARAHPPHFYEELHGEELLTFNPGTDRRQHAARVRSEESLHAETFGKDNIVAPMAVATGDLRTISRGAAGADARNGCSKIVAAHLPHTSADDHFSDSYPPMAPTEGNRKLLAMYDAVSRDLGFGPVTAVDPRRAGAADISFAADHVEMAIDGIGLLGRRHTHAGRSCGPAHVPDPDAASGRVAAAAATSSRLDQASWTSPFERPRGAAARETPALRARSRLRRGATRARPSRSDRRSSVGRRSRAFVQRRCWRVPANRRRRARPQPRRRPGTRTSPCRDPCRAYRSRRRCGRIPSRPAPQSSCPRRAERRAQRCSTPDRDRAGDSRAARARRLDSRACPSRRLRAPRCADRPPPRETCRLRPRPRSAH